MMRREVVRGSVRYASGPTSLLLVLLLGMTTLVGCHHRHGGHGEGLLVLPLRAATRQTTGVLILAHGGAPRWNNAVRQAVEEARLPHPVAIAFGMGMENSRPMVEAVEQLQHHGAKRLLVVPLFVSSHSTIFRQLEYIFRLREEPSFPNKIQRIPETLTIAMTSALNRHPLVEEILWERCQRLIRVPNRETVILIAHGPNEEADNQRWLEDMRYLAAVLRARGGFRDVIPVTLRDDAEPTVKQQATDTFRRAVNQANQSGEVLVIPLLLAQGGIENGIPQRLKGLNYRYSGETLLPHPNIARWIRTQVDGLATNTASGS